MLYSEYVDFMMSKFHCQVSTTSYLQNALGEQKSQMNLQMDDSLIADLSKQQKESLLNTILTNRSKRHKNRLNC